MSEGDYINKVLSRYTDAERLQKLEELERQKLSKLGKESVALKSKLNEDPNFMKLSKKETSLIELGPIRKKEFLTQVRAILSPEELELFLIHWGDIDGNKIFNDFIVKRESPSFGSNTMQDILEKVRPIVNDENFRGSRLEIKSLEEWRKEPKFKPPPPPAPMKKLKPTLEKLKQTKPDLYNYKGLTESDLQEYDRFHDYLGFTQNYYLRELIRLTLRPTWEEARENAETKMRDEFIDSINTWITSIQKNQTKKVETRHEISRYIVEQNFHVKLLQFFEILKKGIFGNKYKSKEEVGDYLKLIEFISDDYNEIKTEIEKDLALFNKREIVFRVNFYYPNPFEVSNEIRYVDFIFYG